MVGYIWPVTVYSISISSMNIDIELLVLTIGYFFCIYALNTEYSQIRLLLQGSQPSYFGKLTTLMIFSIQLKGAYKKTCLLEIYF